MNIQSTNDYRTIGLKSPPKGNVNVRPRKTSQYLSKGAQGQLVDAAVLAKVMGHPVNRTTTIRTEILASGSHGVFAEKHEANGIVNLLELLRHWHKKRGIPWACIWGREVGKDVGGHIHIGTHLSDEHTKAYIEQLARWTGEGRIFPKHHKPPNIGISERGSWLVQCCFRRGQSGTDVAAYLGKDEPSFVYSAWGVTRDNKAKRVLKYPCNGGYIEGTQRCIYRHGTSNNISPTTKANKAILEGLSDRQRLIRPDLSWLPH